MTEHEQLIKDCEDREQKLSDWERGFVDSISHQLGEGRSLTRKQVETLESIWEAITS